MSTRRYIMLMASLPALPWFEQAERLPLSPERFADRLAWLHPDDRSVVHRADEFLSWQRQPVSRRDADVLALYAQFLTAVGNRTLCAMADHRMTMRTVVSALRRRARGESLPGTPWGVEPWAAHIERFWREPHFRLEGRLPWIVVAADRLAASDANGLERVLMGEVWRAQERLCGRDPFSLAALLAYRFRWDVTERWLTRNAVAARERLGLMVNEALAGVGLRYE